jgi:hypothetical protein
MRHSAKDPQRHVHGRVDQASGVATDSTDPAFGPINLPDELPQLTPAAARVLLAMMRREAGGLAKSGYRPDSPTARQS